MEDGREDGKLSSNVLQSSHQKIYFLRNTLDQSSSHPKKLYFRFMWDFLWLCRSEFQREKRGNKEPSLFSFFTFISSLSLSVSLSISPTRSPCLVCLPFVLLWHSSSFWVSRFLVWACWFFVFYLPSSLNLCCGRWYVEEDEKGFDGFISFLHRRWGLTGQVQTPKPQARLPWIAESKIIFCCAYLLKIYAFYYFFWRFWIFLLCFHWF